MKIIHAAYSLIIWGLFLSANILMTPPMLLIWISTKYFDNKRRALHYFTCFWGVCLFFIVPNWRIQIKGKEHIDRKKLYVMVANHQSMVDIMVICHLFIPFKWVSKKELFRVPFVGWMLYLNNYIGISRGSRESAQKMITDCSEVIYGGHSVALFPEGTRSVDGRLRKFKEGAFKIAKNTGTDILPMVITGVQQALPKGAWLLRGKNTVTLHILPPIPYESFRDKSYIEITREVRDYMLPHTDVQ